MKKKPVIIVAVITFLAAAMAVTFMTTSSDERINILTSYNKTTESRTVGVSVTQTQQAVDKAKQELPENDSLLAGIQGVPPDPGSNTYVPGTSGAVHQGTISNHGHMAFKQSNPPWNTVTLGYGDGSYGTISNNGCGLCSHASLLQYFGYNTDPQHLLSYMESLDPGMHTRYWVKGMSHAFPKYLVDLVNAHTDEFGFGLELLATIEGSPISNANFADMFNTFDFTDPNIAATASASAGLFTTGGHIICIPDVPDATSFHVTDSANGVGYANGIAYEQIQDYNFPINSNETVTYIINYNYTDNQGVYHPESRGTCELNNENGYHLKKIWVFRKVPK